MSQEHQELQECREHREHQRGNAARRNQPRAPAACEPHTETPTAGPPTLPWLPVIPHNELPPHRDPPSKGWTSAPTLSSATVTLEEDGAEGTEPRGQSQRDSSKGCCQGDTASWIQPWDLEQPPAGAVGQSRARLGHGTATAVGRHQRAGGHNAGLSSAAVAPATQTRESWTRWSCIHQSQNWDERGPQGTLSLLPEPSTLLGTG